MAQTNKVTVLADNEKARAVSDEYIVISKESLETWKMTLDDGTVVEKQVIVAK